MLARNVVLRLIDFHHKNNWTNWFLFLENRVIHVGSHGFISLCASKSRQKTEVWRHIWEKLNVKTDNGNFFYVGTIKQICVQLHTELMLSAEPACSRPAHIEQLLSKPKLNQRIYFFILSNRIILCVRTHKIQ